MPKGEIREVAAMLTATHAHEDRFVLSTFQRFYNTSPSVSSSSFLRSVFIGGGPWNTTTGDGVDAETLATSTGSTWIPRVETISKNDLLELEKGLRQTLSLQKSGRQKKGSPRLPFILLTSPFFHQCMSLRLQLLELLGVDLSEEIDAPLNGLVLACAEHRMCEFMKERDNRKLLQIDHAVPV